MINEYGHEYSYYTLIADFRQDQLNDNYYLNFIVNTETENGYVTGFNLRLLTFFKDDYHKNEITKELIIQLLEKELQKLKLMTTPNK